MHLKRRFTLPVFSLLLALLLSTSAHVAHAGSFITESYSGRTYKVYIPTSYDGSTAVPLVVMLHGCTQDADQFAAGTRMNDVAESYNVIVMYPVQPSSVNSSQCWRWFETGSQSRGSGDPAIIAGMTNTVIGDYNIDTDRVYVNGLSAGAAMSVIMGATYPDLYAAIGVGAGLEYKAATSQLNAWTAMSSGGPNPDTQGTAAYNAMGSRARVVPTIVFHGTSDYTVQVVNGNQVLSQWAQTNDLASDGSNNNDIDDTPEQTINGQVPGGRSYTRTLYEDSQGNVVMEKYLVDGMGHAWSGGSTAGSYTDPNGPDASTLSMDFFLAHPKGGAVDTTPPTTTASPGGGTYSGSVTVSLSANESATTYYTTDGSTPTTTSSTYSSPLTFTSTTTLKFFSVDAAGNAEAVQTETYTIGQDTTAPITTASPAGGSYESSVTVSLSTNESATTYFTTDGSTPTTSSSTYSSPLTFTANTTLKFFSVDGAGNTEATQTESYTITQPSTTTTTFTSIGSEDGYAGLYWADGASTSQHRIGDKGMFNGDTYRTILSFDTSSLPDDAIILSATLRITRQSQSGTVQTIDIDIREGVFGSSAALTQSDYSAAASALNIASLAAPSSNDTSSEVSLPGSALQYINLSGRTQFRLRATTAINFAVDQLIIYGGEGGSFAPVLIIEYE